MKAKNTIGKIYVSQCLFRTFCKLQSICLIGGRVCNPRQQQVLSIYFSFTQNTFAIFIAPDNTYRNK